MTKLATLFALALPSTALAGHAEVGGYFRVGARPDFQGGNGRLGYWNLYGRLLNEGPYAALEMKFDVLERQPLVARPWTSLHMKIEGGSIGNADAGDGGLANLRLSQVYARAGNVLLPQVTWQVGTLDTYFGDLGLYDWKVAQIFYETVGVSGLWETPHVDLRIGLGDSGWYLRREEYDTILTPGGTLRVRLGDHLELGTGGQFLYEPEIEGDRFAPHSTPDMAYDDWLRGQVVERYLQQYPDREVEFPDPVSSSAESYKVIGYLGFGGFGPIVWNNAYASWQRIHPDNFTYETYEGETYTLYVKDLTDERYALIVGDELQLTVIPNRLDIAWAALYGDQTDLDNNVAPSDYDRTYWSTVLRMQVYLTDTFHWLGESSYAEELSHNGNAFREHSDSIFDNTGGVPDTQGLEYGDTDMRRTWQGKTGFVLNPLGRGIYTRPSLRLLYGVQVSNQNNAFGNSFVEDIDQYNEFGNVERHVHHVVSLETEAWF